MEYKKIAEDQLKFHEGQLKNLKEAHRIELAKQQQKIQSLNINWKLSNVRDTRIDNVAKMAAR